jgi:hypothetical protein
LAGRPQTALRTSCVPEQVNALGALAPEQPGPGVSTVPARVRGCCLLSPQPHHATVHPRSLGPKDLFCRHISRSLCDVRSFTLSTTFPAARGKANLTAVLDELKTVAAAREAAVTAEWRSQVGGQSSRPDWRQLVLAPSPAHGSGCAMATAPSSREDRPDTRLSGRQVASPLSCQMFGHSGRKDAAANSPDRRPTDGRVVGREARNSAVPRGSRHRKALSVFGLALGTSS